MVIILVFTNRYNWCQVTECSPRSDTFTICDASIFKTKRRNKSYGKFFTYELENKYLSQYQYQNDLTLLGREW